MTTTNSDNQGPKGLRGADRPPAGDTDRPETADSDHAPRDHSVNRAHERARRALDEYGDAVERRAVTSCTAQLRHVLGWDEMNTQRVTIADWRTALLAVEQKIPALHAVTVTVVHETATRRIVDTVACAPAAKAAIDGLVDAGLWPDDGPSFVTDVTFRPPRCTGRDALTLILMEVDAAITPDTTGPRALR